MLQAIGKGVLPVALYAGVFIAIYGIHANVTYHQVLLAGNPFERIDVVSLQYLHGSPLGPIITHHLRLWTPDQLIGFYFSLIILCIYVVYSYLRHISQSSNKRFLLFATVLALSPLLHVLISWVGLSDPFLILGYLCFISSRSLVLKNGAIFFMLLAHFHQGILVLIIHAIINFKKEHLKRAWAYMVGVLLGSTTYGLYNFVVGETLSREEYVFQNISEFFSFPTVILSLVFTFSWFGALIIYQLYKKKNPRLFFAVALIITVVTFTIDKTRVGAILSLPLYFATMDFFSRYPLPNMRVLWALVLLSLFQLELNGFTISFVHDNSLLFGR